MQYWWTDYPWRYVQTNLREIDMLDINARQYVKELQNFHATIAMINTSGILASYPTRLEYHWQSPCLKGDSLATIIDECHKAGIKVIARTDFSKIRRPVYEAHPEWAYVSPAGKIVDYNGDVQTCINGDYQQGYMLEIIRETLAELDVDGIFLNMSGYQVSDYSGNYHGICHCDACRKLFMDQYKKNLPMKEEMNDPVYRQYLVFRQDTSEAQKRKVCTYIRSIRPGILINSDSYTLDTGYFRRETNTALDRPLPHWQYNTSENSKWVRGSYPDFRASSGDVDFIDFSIRHVAVSPALQELRLAQGLANGAGLDYYIIGRLDNHEDQSGYPVVKKIFKFHKDHEKYYNQPDSVAMIALIRTEMNNLEYKGWYRVLTEGHFLFDVVNTDRVTAVDLSKYKMLVLPDIRYLSQEQAGRLDAFVKAGGIIISAGQTGFFDECFNLRPVPALRSMGVEKNRLVREDCRGAMFKIRADEYDLMGRFGRTEQLVCLDGAYIFNDYASSTKRRLAYIPPQPFGPPERCYYTEITDLPGLVSNQYGQGTSVCIPWFPGMLLHRQGYQNTWNFLASVLEYYGDDFRVQGDFSPMVEATLQTDQQKSHYLLSLVNATGHFGNSFFAPVALPGVSCKIKIGREPREVISLVSNQPLEFQYDQASGWLQVNFQTVGSYDAAAIQL